MPELIVTQNEDGRFECVQKGATGAATCGRGASVLEAVGSWCIYSQTVRVVCDPMELLLKFAVSNKYKKLKFSEIPTRRS